MCKLDSITDDGAWAHIIRLLQQRSFKRLSHNLPRHILWILQLHLWNPDPQFLAFYWTLPCVRFDVFPRANFLIPISQGWVFEVWLFALYSNNCVMYVKQLCMFTLVVNHPRVDFLPKTPLIFRRERWWGLFLKKHVLSDCLQFYLNSWKILTQKCWWCLRWRSRW